MTILVSALCEDGLVIGADSMASLNLGNTNFVGVDNNKITTIDNYTSQELLNIICSRGDMVFLGALLIEITLKIYLTIII